ncbi:CBS domain-containing protein [Kitasatospora sp. HPMI-4]|uniref:CBS domain-containing protein n=1 Tax=Kitasatospora sp. HPMI-4 TaxID=3448443 RepID=UPI003F1B1B23
MEHRSVADVMTHEVVRVAPGMGFRGILALLTEFDITAVPVVDGDDRPVGIVSEADLLRIQAAQADPAGLAFASAAGDGRQAVTAGELMTSPAICTSPGTSVVAAARLMNRHHVKRLPVVDDDGRLVGMVSRSDLLRVFLRDDHSIRSEIVEDVLAQVTGVSPAEVGVEVDQGRVTLSGTIAAPSLVPIVLHLCRSVDGVVSVTNRLECSAD